MKTADPTNGDLARQLHPSTWLGDDVADRIADLMRQSAALRADLVRLSAELADTLEEAQAARDAVVQKICGPRGSSPVRQVVAERLALMTVGPLVELWRTIAEDAVAATPPEAYSRSESRRWATESASPSDPA